MKSQTKASRQEMPLMSDGEFDLFREFVYEQCGIKLTPSKKTMLSVRLNKRLAALGMNSFGKYYDYLMSHHGRSKELSRMIDVVTTNKTNFFREGAHFDFLKSHVLSKHSHHDGAGNHKKLNVWSAGCSSGEEPYSLAMVLAEYFGMNGNVRFSILATDISGKVLEKARQAIYHKSVIEPIPPPFIRRYMMRGKDSISDFYRVVPELRKCIAFRYLNLMDMDFKIKTPLDIIFCRNVVIYFDRQTQIKLFNKFYDLLTPSGYLFIGNSETLHGISSRFQPVAPTIYRK